MANLSQVQARVGREDRLLKNRSGIIPERRNTEAGQRSFMADMRSARRGDVGGAEELMRIFGRIERGAEAFQDYANKRFEAVEEQNAQLGQRDQMAGTVDEERMRKSRAYSDAVATGRAQSAFYEFLQEREPQLRELLENQTQLTMEEREAEADQWFDQTFREFVTDPETGQPKNFGSVRAYTWLAERVGATRHEMRTRASQRIEERFKGEALTNFSNAIRGAALSGRGVTPETLNEALDALPDTIPQTEITTTLDRTLRAAAVELERAGRPAEAIAIIDQALGIPSGVNPQDPSTVRPVTIQSVDPDTGQPTDGPIVTDHTGQETVNGQPRQPQRVTASRPQRTQAAAPTGRVRATGAAGETAQLMRQHQVAGRRLSEVVIAGFLGNFRHESGHRTNPGAGDNGTAFGMAQWRHERVANFQRVIGKHPSRASRAEQVRFVVWELNNPTAAGMGRTEAEARRNRDRILNARSPEEAARLIDQFYERSNGKSRQERARAAREYFEGNAPDVGDSEGVTPVDPIGSNPDFTLAPEPLDPVEQAEQGNGPAIVPALEGRLALTPEQRVDLMEFRNALASRVRSDWNRERRETQDRTAWEMQLRLYGRGEPLTPAEVDAAAQAGNIRPEQQIALFDQMRQNFNMQQSYEDRVEREAEEAEQEAKEQQAEGIISRYVGSVLRGQMTPGAARQQLLQEALRIRDPQVRGAVLGQVDSQLTNIEQMRQSNPVLRSTIDELGDLEQAMNGDIARLVPRPRREEASRVVSSEMDRARTRIARAVADGQDPQAAARAEAARIRSKLQTFIPQQR